MTMFIAGKVQAQQVDDWLKQADTLFTKGQTAEAKALHEKILQIYPDCFESNVWLGNYHYLKGDARLHEIEADYKRIDGPSRMQTARYQEQQKTIYADYYSKADVYLKKALQIRKNEHLQQLTDAIETYRVRIGLVAPAVRKRLKK